MRSTIVSTILLASCVSAFVLPSRGPISQRRTNRFSTGSSYLDDLGASPAPEPAVTDDAKDTSSVKDDLMKEIDLASSMEKRTAVNELMLKLEAMNPTDAPARSPLLNGVWEFLYTGGMSPGMLAIQVLSKTAKKMSSILDLKAATLTIKRDQPRTEAAVTVSALGRDATIKVFTSLEVESDIRLVEKYEEGEIAGMKLKIPAPLQMSRTLFITYLDDDIIIARDNTGSPDLLVRKDKEFSSYTVPSYSDTDYSPGSS